MEAKKTCSFLVGTAKDKMTNEELNQEKEQDINNDIIEEKEVDLQKQFDELQEKHSELNDKYLRLCAEFDNYKKRTSKEKMNLIDTANMQLIIDLLPIIDDFERGLESIEKNQTLDAIAEAYKIIYQKFMNILAKYGVEAINPIDEPFNMDLHEAISTIEGPPEKKNMIADVVLKGYKLNLQDRPVILRYAKVIVYQ
jgi:molecular chaperone GrpE